MRKKKCVILPPSYPYIVHLTLDAEVSSEIIAHSSAALLRNLSIVTLLCLVSFWIMQTT
jgi:hypothetical protein